MNMKKVELLAPAGNIQAFYGAINAGADAVYLGGSSFGARAYADNFSVEELLKCIEYAHIFNKKIYLTVNTLVKDREFEALHEFITPLYEAHIDGLIIQDLGVFQYIKNHFPEMELHASTQMTICSEHGAKLLKEMGASRIVPARELSLKELISIKNNVDIEIEAFIHGAMCYCYSGQCLYSSILGGRSGNRGRCAQPCRLPYTVKTGNVQYDEAYYLSLKDMCTIESIPDLIQSGIDSFKIEGRMKRPEYAAGVTSIYRKYIDKYYALLLQHSPDEAKAKFYISSKDLERLKGLYIRSEIHDGYYYKNNGKDMLTINTPSYNTNDENLIQDIRNKYIEQVQKLPVSMFARFQTGTLAELYMTYNNITVKALGNKVDVASNQPITIENVQRQLQRLGDSCFICDKFECTVDENAFYPLKHMNELRRSAVNELVVKILESYGYSGRNKPLWHPLQASGYNDQLFVQSDKNRPRFSVSIETLEQYFEIKNWIINHPGAALTGIYIPSDLFLTHTELQSDAEELSSYLKIYLSLPYILRERDINSYRNILQFLEQNPYINEVLVRNLDQLSLLIYNSRSVGLRTDAGLYAWNHHAMNFLSDKVSCITLPYELNAAEQRQLPAKSKELEKVVYGRIPMMITSNCIMKTTNSCLKTKKAERVCLSDRYSKEFPVILNCSHCYNVIYNSVPLYLNASMPDKKITTFRLSFTTESARRTRELLDAYLLGNPLSIGEYTTGHEKRGVE